MKEYKILVGLHDNNGTLYPHEKVQKIVKRYFNTYTLHNATGSYNGILEPVIVITIIVNEKTVDNFNWIVVNCAKELKKELNQEEVLVTSSVINILKV